MKDRTLVASLAPIALAALAAPLASAPQTGVAPVRDTRVVYRTGDQPGPSAPVTGSIQVSDLTTGLTPLDLVRFLVGPEVFVADVLYTGCDTAGGIFTNGTGIIGFEEGIVFSTGALDVLPTRMNQGAGITSFNGAFGDPDLDDLIPGAGGTFNAASLEFDFECPDSDSITFQFVFGSEEYSEFVGTQFNDLFGLFVNGEHVPAIPGTTRPVSINSINCGNPNDPSSEPSNCELFIDNSCDRSVPFPYPCTSAVPLELDGLTVVLSATAELQPGLNHVKLVIADMADFLYDSAVFVRSEGFSCTTGGFPVFDPPSPCGQILNASAGLPIEFDVVALATNGEPGASVSLSVVGDPAPIVDGTFDPPLPTGPEPVVMTHFTWTPGMTDLGDHTLVFTATDQLGRTTECTVTVSVAECFLVLGHTTTGVQLPLGGPEDLLLVEPASIFPVTLTEIPSFEIPDAPAMMLARFYLQVYMVNPSFDPLDPVKVTNGLEVHVGGGVMPFGEPDGMHLWLEGSAVPGGVVRPRFSIDGM